MKRVSVEWIDATSTHESGWKSAEELKKLTPSVSHFTGWLIFESDTYLVFAAHKIGEGEDEAFDGDLCLPRGCITSMVEVQDGHGRSRPRNAAGAGKPVGLKKSRNRRAK